MIKRDRILFERELGSLSDNRRDKERWILGRRVLESLSEVDFLGSFKSC